MLGTQTLTFLADLKANNRREWFEANKARYASALKEPAEHFAGAMAAVLEAETGMAYRRKIFRVYRDVRFSRDKTPYNAHLHIGFHPDAAGPDAPAWLFGLEPERLVLGAGVFAFSPEGLDRWRGKAASEDGTALGAILAGLARDGVRIDEPELKRVPAPYPADHPNADLLRRKGFAAWIDAPDPAIALGETGPQTCTARLMRLRPVFDWLMAV